MADMAEIVRNSARGWMKRGGRLVRISYVWNLEFQFRTPRDQ